MSKCSCPNSFCRCLYGCACRIENSNAKKLKKCLCCQISSLSKTKKQIIHLPTHECQSIPDPGRVDDIITKLGSDDFESVRYSCKVEITNNNKLEITSKFIEEFETFEEDFKITLIYDLPEKPEFNDQTETMKKIIIVDSSTLYCIGISISDNNITKLNHKII